MKTINTKDATGSQLDWLVAKAADCSLNMLDLLYDIKCYSKFNPSTDWSQGGPIMEQEDIGFLPTGDAAMYEARQWVEEKLNFRVVFGPTPLIAAMRCFVVSELGETAEVPEELK